MGAAPDIRSEDDPVDLPVTRRAREFSGAPIGAMFRPPGELWTTPGLRVGASSTALLPQRFAQGEIDAGRVVTLPTLPTAMHHPYRLVYRKALAKSAALQATLRVLVGQDARDRKLDVAYRRQFF